MKKLYIGKRGNQNIHLQWVPPGSEPDYDDILMEKLLILLSIPLSFSSFCAFFKST